MLQDRYYHSLRLQTQRHDFYLAIYSSSRQMGPVDATAGKGRKTTILTYSESS